MKDFEQFAHQVLSLKNIEKMQLMWKCKSSEQGSIDNLEYVSFVMLTILMDYHEWMLDSED